MIWKVRKYQKILFKDLDNQAFLFQRSLQSNPASKEKN